MQFDLGFQGLAILTICAVAFGLVVEIVGRSVTVWIGLIAAIGWFVGGLLTSEVMFATVTEEELQPIIDGLAFDESLLGGLIVGSLAAIATWLAARGGQSHRPTAV
jgi:uncharacterized membrane protein